MCIPGYNTSIQSTDFLNTLLLSLGPLIPRWPDPTQSSDLYAEPGCIFCCRYAGATKPSTYTYQYRVLGGPCGRQITYFIFQVQFGCLRWGPGGIRLAWNQCAKLEQGGWRKCPGIWYEDTIGILVVPCSNTSWAGQDANKIAGLVFWDGFRKSGPQKFTLSTRNNKFLYGDFFFFFREIARYQ